MPPFSRNLQPLLFPLLAAFPTFVSMCEEPEWPAPGNTEELQIHNLVEIVALLVSITAQPESINGHEDKLGPFLELRASLGEEALNLVEDKLKERAKDALSAAIRGRLPIRKDDALELMEPLQWRDGKLVVFLRPEEHFVVDDYLDRLQSYRHWFLVHRDFPKLLERLRSASGCSNGVVTKEAPRSARSCGTVTLRSQALGDRQLAQFLKILTRPAALSVATAYTTGCHDPAGSVRMEMGKNALDVQFLLDPRKIEIRATGLYAGGYELSAAATREVGDWSTRAIGYNITVASPPADQGPRRAVEDEEPKDEF